MLLTTDQIDEILLDSDGNKAYPIVDLLINNRVFVQVKLFARDKSSATCYGFETPEPAVRINYRIGAITYENGGFSSRSFCRF